MANEKRYFETGDFKILGRNDILWMCAFMAAAGGILLPWTGTMFDVMLTFCLSLSAGILIICLSAGSATDAAGFPLMYLMAGILHFGCSFAGARLFFYNETISKITSFIADSVLDFSTPLLLTLFGTGSIVFFGFIYKNLRSIISTAGKYFEDIVTEKKIDINCELESGLINNQQAFELKQKLNSHTTFFLAVSGISRFFIFIVFTQLAIAVTTLFGAVFLSVTGNSGDAFAMSSFIKEVTALNSAILMSVLVSVWATSLLVRKCLLGIESGDEKDFDDRISIFAREIIESETEPKGIRLHKEKKMLSASVIEMQNSTKPWVWEKIKDVISFDELAGRVTERCDGELNLVLAGTGARALPVTVPVNLGMKFVKAGRRILLVDMDCNRRAVFKVFDKEAGSSDGPVETFVDGLFISQAGRVRENASEFDTVIFYAPDGLEKFEELRMRGRNNAIMFFGEHEDNRPLNMNVDEKWDIISPAEVA